MTRDCPIPRTHARLRQAHLLWHQALDRYPDADAFCTNLNACVAALRSVTFVLQKEAKREAGFAAWYDEWRERLRMDAIMRWLVDARNRIEKEGDLDVHSTAVVSVVADWLEHPPLHDVRVPALLPPRALAKYIVASHYDRLSEQVRREGVLVVERRWVVRDLPEREILDVLAECHGCLSRLVRGAHELLGASPDISCLAHTDAAHAGNTLSDGRPACMDAAVEFRTARLNLATGRFLTHRETTMNAIGLRQRAVDRYDLSRFQPATSPDPFRVAERALELAKVMLQRDGGLATVAMLLGATGELFGSYQLVHDDQQEKHLMMRKVAVEVQRTGATAVVLIAEAWLARPDTVPSGGRAADAPDREEAVLVHVATADGRARSMGHRFRRNDDKIIFDAEPWTNDHDEASAALTLGVLEPVRAAWRRRRSLS